mmetsp:Transcript_6408/g.15193  ORF Transcript_6408/g.15193 Transcript_6408/m.15193 type:complete len:97 (+) Transcript_6408:166-456(+)
MAAVRRWKPIAEKELRIPWPCEREQVPTPKTLFRLSGIVSCIEFFSIFFEIDLDPMDEILLRADLSRSSSEDTGAIWHETPGLFCGHTTLVRWQDR